MGPALTHVSMKYGDSGWKHVTAEEAEALFPKQSVSAGTRQFICECCGQYVSFTKDGINNNMRECGYHLMLWKHGFAKKRIDADVVISDTEVNVIEESSIKKFPKNRTLLVSVCYDGQIIIRQDSQTKEIIPIKNGEQKKIHVDSDSEIIVTQGCDAVRTLSVDVQEKVHGISVFSKKPARVNYLYGKVASNSYMTEKEKAAMRKSIYAGEFPVKSLRSVTHFGAK